MAGTVHSTTFHPVSTPAPDWSDAVNWSSGIVPDAGVVAELAGVTAMVDPGIVLDTTIDLSGAALIGNGGAIALGAGAIASITGIDALYADDSFVNWGNLDLGAGSALDVVVDLGAVSGLTSAPPPSFANTGTIDIETGATLDIRGTEFENYGTILLKGGTLKVTGGAIGGEGIINLADGALAVFGDQVAEQDFAFGPGGGTVVLDDAAPGAGVTVSGFGAGDTLALPDLADARIVQNADRIIILNRAGQVEGGFVDSSDARLAAIAEGSGSAIVAADPAFATVTANPPCFVRGTAILTPSGYRPVETLIPGDHVVTASGLVEPLIWAGSRKLDLAVHPAPERVHPIRIEPDALAPGVPRRPLRVSPDHALFFDTVLIPVKHLVNGATILRETDCTMVCYHHVELARHGLVLAEAVSCESYLDTGNRAGFDRVLAWPVRTKRQNRDACAPLCTAGPVLHAVRARLHARVLERGFSPRHDDAIDVRVDGTALPRRPGPANEIRFRLPTHHCGSATIHSARFVPADFDPASEDRRELGIALAYLRAGRKRHTPEALAEAGFHPRAAGDPSLWTTGAGIIRLPPDVRSLALGLAATPLFWTRTPA
ncbi:MAG TPA: Hint domain-containing protein [Acidiphilium sp.]